MSIARCCAPGANVTEREAELNAWLEIIKGEYKEMPGLQLTKWQVQRLWGLDASAVDTVLATLQAADFLRVTSRGCYVLADGTADTSRVLTCSS
jgi:hypothetical protein